MGAAIEIETAVYTAFRGYSWSSIPGSVGKDRMDTLYRMAAEVRGEFPSPEAVDVGIVSDGVFAAAFSIFTAPGWDVEGRSAEYAAFAFVPCADAASVDFATLLCEAFFHAPTHEPPSSISYSGPVAANPPVDAPGRLLSGRKISDFNLSAAGRLLAMYGRRSGRWVFRVGGDSGMSTAESGPWRIGANTKG
jgi:hypothetical protein